MKKRIYSARRSRATVVEDLEYVIAITKRLIAAGVAKVIKKIKIRIGSLFIPVTYQTPMRGRPTSGLMTSLTMQHQNNSRGGRVDWLESLARRFAPRSIIMT